VIREAAIRFFQSLDAISVQPAALGRMQKTKIMADDKTPTLNIPNTAFTGSEVWVEPGQTVVVTYRFSDPITAKQVGEQARMLLGNFVSVSDDQDHRPGRVRLHIFLQPQ
jgi:hypothetical protein